MNRLQVTQLQVGACSHPGKKRKHQEDDFSLDDQFRSEETWPTAQLKGNLYIVADGMGGHKAGEIASQMVVDLVRQLYYDDQSPNVERSLRHAIEEANRQIYQQAQEIAQERGMASTIAAAVIRGDELHVAHVGDSRIYLLRAGELKQLTEDHSWVAEQVRRGLIPPEKAASHPQRSLVTRAMGHKPSVDVDYQLRKLEQGDVVLLCSDGLYIPVGEEEIRQVLNAYEPQDACRDLIALANKAGGPDNVTAIVIRVDKIVPLTGSQNQPEKRIGKKTIKEPNRTVSMNLGMWVSLIVILGLVSLSFFLMQENARLRKQLAQKGQDTELEVNLLEPTSSRHPACKPMPIQAQVWRENNPVDNIETSVTVHGPDGTDWPVDLIPIGDGVYSAQLASKYTIQEGKYRLELIAQDANQEIRIDKEIQVLLIPYLDFVKPLAGDTVDEGDITIRAAIKIGCELLEDNPTFSSEGASVVATLQDVDGNIVGETRLQDNGIGVDERSVDGLFSGIIQDIEKGEYTLTIDLSAPPLDNQDSISSHIHVER